MLRVREKVIPLIDLGCALGQAAERGGYAKAVVVEVKGQQLALGVDTVAGRFRGAVSPLPPCQQWHTALGGCVVLSSGGIGFSLDVEALVRQVSKEDAASAPRR